MQDQRNRIRSQVTTLALQRDSWVSHVTLAKALFFAAAGLSFLMSVYLFFSGDRERGIFVGLWVPSILSAGTLLVGRSNDD